MLKAGIGKLLLGIKSALVTGSGGGGVYTPQLDFSDARNSQYLGAIA